MRKSIRKIVLKLWLTRYLPPTIGPTLTRFSISVPISIHNGETVLLIKAEASSLLKTSAEIKVSEKQYTAQSPVGLHLSLLPVEYDGLWKSKQ